MKNKNEEIVLAIIDILNGRGGFDDWWGNIDEFHEEIIEECCEAIEFK